MTMQKIESVIGAAQIILGSEKEISAILETVSARNERVVVYMGQNDVSMQDMRETFQTMEGSDWPKVDDSFVGEVKAQATSMHARAFNRFRASVTGKFEFVKDGEGRQLPVIKKNKPVAKTASVGNTGKSGNTSKGDNSPAKISGGPDLWVLALNDMLSHVAKERAALGKGKAARAKLAAIAAKIELIEELACEFELDDKLASNS